MDVNEGIVLLATLAAKGNNANSVKNWEKVVERRREAAASEDDFRAAWKKDYREDFNPDLDEYLKKRWEKQLSDIYSFIDETIEYLQAEVTARKK